MMTFRTGNGVGRCLATVAPESASRQGPLSVLTTAWNRRYARRSARQVPMTADAGFLPPIPAIERSPRNRSAKGTTPHGREYAHSIEDRTKPNRTEPNQTKTRLNQFSNQLSPPSFQGLSAGHRAQVLCGPVGVTVNTFDVCDASSCTVIS